ncbi:MAG: MotA/TolQ/ExbB proton channel family protein [Bryobacteraceae bacterium]|jgi:hypothetical protein
MLGPLDSATLQAVGRASERSSRLVHEEMKQGLYGVATIACLAPWIGLFGTILGIVNSFQGISGERWAAMAAICEGLSQSMWPTAFGLLVGIVALSCYRYLEDRLQTLDHEMEGASLELINQLSHLSGRFTVTPAINRISDGPMFGERSLAELSRDETSWRRCMLLTATAIAMTWLVQLLRYFDQYSLSLYSSMQTACLYIPFMLGISCVLVYPVWTRLLHRRPGGLVALGSTFCLSWSLAELVVGLSLP